MSSASVFAKLREVGAPTVTTREAAAALRVSTSSASRALRTLAERGLAQRIRHGLWSLADRTADPRLLAGEITRPHPAYISFASALAAHGVIDQIPREIALASTGRAKRVRTSQGIFVVHRVPPRLFGGQRRRKLSSISSTSAKRAGGPASACRSSIYRDRSRGARLRGGSNGLVQLDSGSS